MIPVESLLIEIDERLNKLSTHQHQEIPVENKIIALNEGQIKLIKRKLNSNNPLRTGLDGNDKRHQDLQVLIEPAEKHELEPQEKNKNLNRWTVSLKDLKPQFLFHVSAYLIADKESCKDRIVYINDALSGHGSIHRLLQNSNYTPSFEYQETFGEFSSDELGFYTDGTFTPKKLFISYLRYPKKIDYEGYEHLVDGTPSKKQDCELPEYLKDELLDIVVADLALYTENNFSYQGATQNKLSNE